MPIPTINADEYKAAINSNKLAIIDWFAAWCGDCKMIDPFYDKYAAEERYKHVYFARIDVDKYNDTAKATDVRKMPTFQIYKDGVKIEQIFEPKPKDLSDFFEKHLLE